MVPEDELNKRYKQALIIAVLMLVAIPIIFVALAAFVQTEKIRPIPAEDSYKFMFYMIGLVAFVEPFVYLLVRRVQVGNFRKNTETKMTVGQFVLNQEITRFAFVSSIYVYGLITFFVSADATYMFYFYIYAIVWAVIYWPRYEKIKSLMESLEVS